MTTTRPAVRPAEFDKRLMAYMPAIRKSVNLRVPYAKREDTLQEVLADIIGNWQKFRHEGDYHGFFVWAKWRVKAVVSKDKQKRSEPVCHKEDADVSVAARQEDIVLAGQVVRRLKRSRAGRMHLRYAAGESQTSIGKRRTLSAARVQQLVAKSTADIRMVAT